MRYIGSSDDEKVPLVNALAPNPCPSDRWCVGVRTNTSASGHADAYDKDCDAVLHCSPFSLDSWCDVESVVDSIFAELRLSSSHLDDVGSHLKHDDVVGDEVVSMQMPIFRDNGLQSLEAFAPGASSVKIKVWFLGRRDQPEFRPYMLTLRKNNAHEWQQQLRSRWSQLFGEGSPVANIVVPTPPVRDVDEAFPVGEAHVLVSLHSNGVAVLLDVVCPDWTMRHAWMVQARTVADLFVRVGLAEYLYDSRYECVMEHAGDILHIGSRIDLAHGYYGKLVVTELSPQADSLSLSSGERSTTCESFYEAEDGGDDDFASLFQSFSECVVKVQTSIGEGEQCRFLGEGSSRLDHLPVDIPDVQEDIDDTDATFSDDGDMLRTSNPQDLYALQGVLPPEGVGTWRLVTYGLREIHLGRKDATLHSLDLAYIEQAVWMLWQDDVPQFAPLVVHFIVPQPLRALGLEHAVVVVAEILRDSQAEMDHADLSAILNLQVDERGIAIRSPRAAAVPLHSRFSLLHEIHEDSYLCHPFGVRGCSLSVGGILIRDGMILDVIPGSLNQLALDGLPAALIAASAWFPKVEIWASHVTNEHFLDRSDDFLASIYVPGRDRVDVPFTMQDVLAPDAFRHKVAVATQLIDFVLIYVEDNLVSSLCRPVGRHHHLLLWSLQDIQQPVLVALATLTGQPAYHVTAVSFTGVVDIHDIQTRAEMALGLEHRDLICTQQGRQVGFYGVDPALMVLFRPIAVPTARVSDGMSRAAGSDGHQEEDAPISEINSDSMSLIQRNATRKRIKMASAGYTEDNVDLRSGPFDVAPDLAEVPVPTPCPSDRWCVCSGADADQGAIAADVDPQLLSLRRILDDLSTPWPIDGIATCYDAIPKLHPFAKLALASSRGQDVDHVVRYHIFTDGSARRSQAKEKRAAWAFHIVCESGYGTDKVFHRLGYTGALLDSSLLDCQLDALDAEAMALVAVADWLLSVKHPMAFTIHFDAQAVGHGTFGISNVVCETAAPRTLQRAARAVLAIAQARHPGLLGVHVKAHAGQPDNEIADSIAHAILCGWDPPCTPPCRVAELVQHPLRDWGWLECAPTRELPSIETMLQTPSGPAKMKTDYFDINSTDLHASCTSVTWRFGSANVSTLADHDPRLTDKVAVLYRQIKQEGLDILVFQECRGR